VRRACCFSAALDGFISCANKRAPREGTLALHCSGKGRSASPSESPRQLAWVRRHQPATLPVARAGVCMKYPVYGRLPPASSPAPIIALPQFAAACPVEPVGPQRHAAPVRLRWTRICAHLDRSRLAFAVCANCGWDVYEYSRSEKPVHQYHWWTRRVFSTADTLIFLTAWSDALSAVRAD
jgi:hypothetical protein